MYRIRGVQSRKFGGDLGNNLGNILSFTFGGAKGWEVKSMLIWATIWTILWTSILSIPTPPAMVYNYIFPFLTIFEEEVLFSSTNKSTLGNFYRTN